MPERPLCCLRGLVLILDAKLCAVKEIEIDDAQWLYRAMVENHADQGAIQHSHRFGTFGRLDELPSAESRQRVIALALLLPFGKKLGAVFQDGIPRHDECPVQISFLEAFAVAAPHAFLLIPLATHPNLDAAVQPFQRSRS